MVCLGTLGISSLKPRTKISWLRLRSGLVALTKIALRNLYLESSWNSTQIKLFQSSAEVGAWSFHPFVCSEASVYLLWLCFPQNHYWKTINQSLLNAAKVNFYHILSLTANLRHHSSYWAQTVRLFSHDESKGHCHYINSPSGTLAGC